jgi:hypothetical protein
MDVGFGGSAYRGTSATVNSLTLVRVPLVLQPPMVDQQHLVSHLSLQAASDLRVAKI